MNKLLDSLLLPTLTQLTAYTPKYNIPFYTFILHTGLPKLANPPLVFDVGCKQLSVRVSQWTEEIDIGEPEVGQYM